MSTLNKIIEERKKSLPSKALQNEWENSGILPSNRDFKKAITRYDNSLSIKNIQEKRPHLIAELKRKSPSLGELNPSITVKQAWELYSSYASAISILTEPVFFGGSLNDLKEADHISNLPLLRKDFIIDPAQVKEARYYGADSYLLIVAALSKNQLTELIQAGAEYNMPALVEIHNEAELDMVLENTFPKNSLEILGINNRNLHDLTIDLSHTSKIIKKIPDYIKESLVIISESGFHTRNDIDLLPPEVDAVLMGTRFMKSNNPQETIKNLWDL